LDNNNVSSIAIDGSGTNRIGTDDGELAAFNKNGIPVGIAAHYTPIEIMAL